MELNSSRHREVAGSRREVAGSRHIRNSKFFNYNVFQLD